MGTVWLLLTDMFEVLLYLLESEVRVLNLWIASFVVKKWNGKLYKITMYVIIKFVLVITRKEVLSFILSKLVLLGTK